jgi:hypothetical protein
VIVLEANEYPQVAVLVPNNRRLELFFPIEKNDKGWGHYAMNAQILAWIDRATARLTHDSNDGEARDDLEQICRLVIFNGRDEKTEDAKAGRGAQFSDEVFSCNVEIALDLDDKTLFLEAYRNRARKAPISMCQSVGIGLLRYDIRSSLPE